MKNLKNIEKLSAEIRKKITVYMQKLLCLHGDNIVSIFIYGSAASGDFMPGVSDINSAVVFKDLGFAQLKGSLKLINKGIRERIAAPLFLTPGYIKASTDTFPLEFMEMKENHVLIYGEDILNSLEIDPSNIRFVCEEQLKGKLIRIRQAYLEIGLRRKGMEALIKESLNSLFPVFRGLLRLKSIAPPTKKEALLRLLAETFEVDGNPFLAILKDTRNDERIAGEELEGFLERYIKQIEKLAEISDRL